MRYLIPLLFAPLAFAHPEHGTKPGDGPQTAVHAGNHALHQAAHRRLYYVTRP